MKIALWVAIAVLAFVAVDRLALWLESRGWIYYRKRKPRSSALGNAFLEVQALIEPEKKQLLEVLREEDADEDESGDPPEPIGAVRVPSEAEEPPAIKRRTGDQDRSDPAE